MNKTYRLSRAIVANKAVLDNITEFSQVRQICILHPVRLYSFLQLKIMLLNVSYRMAYSWKINFS